MSNLDLVRDNKIHFFFFKKRRLLEPFKIAPETLMRGKQDWEHTDYLNNKGRAFSFPKSRENSFLFSQGSHTDFLNSSESVFIHAGFFFFFF